MLRLWVVICGIAICLMVWDSTKERLGLDLEVGDKVLALYLCSKGYYSV
jgi:hypothetical protein